MAGYRRRHRGPQTSPTLASSRPVLPSDPPYGAVISVLGLPCLRELIWHGEAARADESLPVARSYESLFNMQGNLLKTYRDELESFDTSNTVISLAAGHAASLAAGDHAL
jgi:hypothetical protein